MQTEGVEGECVEAEGAGVNILREGGEGECGEADGWRVNICRRKGWRVNVWRQKGGEWMYGGRWLG